jgi:TctA family transporter
MVFIERPISLGFLIATVLILIVMAAPAMRSKREQITDEAT